MSQDNVDRSPPDRLARLMKLRSGAGHVWQDHELQALLRHQLAAPVQVDLGALPTGDAARLFAVAAAQGLLLRSFDDLLHHPAPPAELLAMVKDFAKANLDHPDSPLPADVARVLYYAAIAAALRGGRRITSLDDAALRRGLTWCMGLAWVDPRTRGLVGEAMAKL